MISAWRQRGLFAVGRWPWANPQRPLVRHRRESGCRDVPRGTSRSDGYPAPCQSAHAKCAGKGVCCFRSPDFRSVAHAVGFANGQIRASTALSKARWPWNLHERPDRLVRANRVFLAWVAPFTSALTARAGPWVPPPRPGNAGRKPSSRSIRGVVYLSASPERDVSRGT